MRSLRREAREAAREKDDYDAEQVRRAAKVFSYSAGMGADNSRPRQLVHGSAEELASVAKILSKAVKLCQWPSQMLANLVALLSKDVESDRPITLTSGYYRLFCKIEGAEIAGWDAAKAGHWDAAVRNSSCLRAAIVSEMSTEIAVAAGVTQAELVLDVQKFFDTMKPEYVVCMGRRLRYPVIPMAMGMMIHSAVRYITCNSGTARAAVPQRSIIAGCGQSIPFTRLFLYDVLEEAHKVSPGVVLRTWVDDLRARFWASREGLMRQ
eukprot:5896378-Karenia_brevis.AAC.1